MQKREVRWELMFPDELEAAVAEFPVVYMPYGLCEPHGPQNVLWGVTRCGPRAICAKRRSNTAAL